MESQGLRRSTDKNSIQTLLGHRKYIMSVTGLLNLISTQEIIVSTYYVPGMYMDQENKAAVMSSVTEKATFL